MKKLILTLLHRQAQLASLLLMLQFSSLTDLGNNLAVGDLLPVTDISDTTQSAKAHRRRSTATNVGHLYLNDTAFAAGWNADTTHAPTKNAIYDYLHLSDADDDGKIDVIDLRPPDSLPSTPPEHLSPPAPLRKARRLMSPMATARAGNPTVAFDSTEVEATTWGAGGNASNIWTFNLSGTDPVLTLSSGVFNVSTGTLQQGGVDVLTVSGTQSPTNKTFDAAPRNILKFRSLPQFTSPLRVDGTNCTIGTTSTSVGYGLGDIHQLG